jgi:hypothetical protein
MYLKEAYVKNIRREITQNYRQWLSPKNLMHSISNCVARFTVTKQMRLKANHTEAVNFLKAAKIVS